MPDSTPQFACLEKFSKSLILRHIRPPLFSYLQLERKSGTLVFDNNETHRSLSSPPFPRRIVAMKREIIEGCSCCANIPYSDRNKAGVARRRGHHLHSSGRSDYEAGTGSNLREDVPGEAGDTGASANPSDPRSSFHLNQW
jgi:hypothetical protein